MNWAVFSEDALDGIETAPILALDFREQAIGRMSRYGAKWYFLPEAYICFGPIRIGVDKYRQCRGSPLQVHCRVIMGNLSLCCRTGNDWFCDFDEVVFVRGRRLTVLCPQVTKTYTTVIFVPAMVSGIRQEPVSWTPTYDALAPTVQIDFFEDLVRGLTRMRIRGPFKLYVGLAVVRRSPSS